MTKIVLVETVSTFRHVYAVSLPDNEPADYALDDVVVYMGEDKMPEVSQHHISEDIFNYRVVTEDEYLELFDRENDYLKHWPKEKKLEFIYDSLKNREEQITKEVNLSNDC